MLVNRYIFLIKLKFYVIFSPNKVERLIVKAYTMKIMDKKLLHLKRSSLAVWMTVVMMSILNVYRTNAQCQGPYQEYMSVGATLPTGWSFEGAAATGLTQPTINATATNARTGTRCIIMSQASPTTSLAVVTTAIPSVDTFSFWIRKGATGTIQMLYALEVSFDNGASWLGLTNGSNSVTFASTTYNYTATLPMLPAVAPTSSAYQEAKVQFTSTVPSCKFRIRDNRALSPSSTLGSINIDDISWTSKIATDNTKLIPVLSSAATCSFSIPSGGVYYLYDVGGDYDTYSANQTNNYTFNPVSSTAKIKATFEAFTTANVAPPVPTTGTNSAILTMDDGTVTNAYYGGTVPVPYTSVNALGTLNLNFRSEAAAVINATTTGYKIRIEAVDCANPATLAAAPSDTDVFLSWSGSGTNFDFYYGPTGVTPPTGTTTPTLSNVAVASHTVGSPYNLTGLTSSTGYQVWIRNNCGSSTSSWVGPVSFTTLCAPTTVTYIENFNGLAGPLPTCTSCTVISGSNTWSTNITNGNLFTNVVGATFFTKGVSLVPGVYRLSYDFSTNLNGTGSLDVYYGRTDVAPTDANISSYLTSHTDFSVIDTNVTTFTISTAGVYYIAFNVTDLTDPVGGQINLDNIKLELDTCKAPSFTLGTIIPQPVATSATATGSVTGVTDTQATVTWNLPSSGAPSNGYLYLITTSPTIPSFNATATGSTPTNSVVLSGLSPNTTYYFWVRGNCGSQLSNWGFNDSTTSLQPAAAIFKTDSNTSVVVVMNNGSSTGCNFSFFDSGNTTANYVNNEVYSYVFYPGTAGSALKAVFNSFSTENNWDGLMIYSGNGPSRVLISSGRAAGFNATTCPAGAFSGTASPGTIISSAADGSLTFEFKSDYIITSSGWAATLSCVTVPKITSFTPTNNNCGTTGTVVTITGTNLSSVLTSNGVFFNGVAATTYTVVSNTQIVATVPATATTGPIRLVTSQAFTTSTTNFVIQSPPPTTTGTVICAGGSGTINSTTVCSGYNDAVTSISGTLSTSAPSAFRPIGSSNSTACGFSTVTTNYDVIPFQVSVTGSYVFETTDDGIDRMGYIALDPFTAGTCSANFVIGDDDSGAGLQPRLTVTLTAGVTYLLFVTTYNATTTAAYNWTITPPVGGSALLFQNSAVQWYTSATGGTPIASGVPFNPVGVAGSGLVNTNTPGVYTYYAACSSNSTCRTATTFEIKPRPTVTAPANANVCQNTVVPMTVSGTANTYTWSSSVANTLFSDSSALVPYVAGTNATTVYVKTPSTATITITGTVTATGCTATATSTVTVATSTWNGSSWTPSAPTATTTAVFNGNYTSTGDLTVCSVVVNSGVVQFNSGHTLTVQGIVTVNGGNLNFADQSSLLQPNDITNSVGNYTGGNSGNISYTRVTTPLMKFDYTYWSTPVSPQLISDFTPLSPLAYSYDNATQQWQSAALNTSMVPGNGYIVRAPNNHPVAPSPPSTFTANFVGVPNNGTITVPVVGGATMMNLLGNPYPSALSADAFLSDSSNAATLSGSLYFWTHNTPINAAYQYTSDDYAIYNYMGGTVGGQPTGQSVSNGVNNSVPNGKIASGQGFFVRGLVNANATFKNTMRLTGNNSQFFRMNSAVQTVEDKHRFWLDVFNSQGAFKQQLIGYADDATNGLDRLYDAEAVESGNAIAFYTKVGNTKLSIQGKPLPFDVNEEIPLGFKSTIDSNFTIRLNDFDGLFTTQSIYLEDLYTGVIHDLKLSDYNFVTSSGVYEDRFLIRFTNSTLSAPSHLFSEADVIAYKKGNSVVVESTASFEIASVTIIDVMGRKIAERVGMNDTKVSFVQLPSTEQVLFVKVTNTHGVTVTKRIVY